MSATAAPPIAPPITRREEDVARYAAVKQYSFAAIVAVWAAAAIPMAILAWIVAPAVSDRLSGAGDVPMFKALIICLTGGLIWQFVLVLVLVAREQGNIRWSTLRDALWLRSPRSPGSGRTGGRLWLIVLPLIVLFAMGELLPTFSHADNRDFGKFLDSDAAHSFLSGNWGWYAIILVFFVFNTVLGEELLFRGLLLPRMSRVFGRGDWAANGAFFAAYHLHVPFMIPATLLFDTFAIAYPSRRYQSAWIGIAVHSAQSVVVGAIILTLVV
jgi:uncharacterized protein